MLLKLLKCVNHYSCWQGPRKWGVRGCVHPSRNQKFSIFYSDRSHILSTFYTFSARFCCKYPFTPLPQSWSFARPLIETRASPNFMTLRRLWVSVPIVKNSDRFHLCYVYTS